MGVLWQLSSAKDMRRLSRLYADGKVFCAFDTETTGGSSKKEHIIEICAIRFSCDGVLGEYHTFIKPPCEIPPVITDITGINDAMVADAPPFAAIAGEFLAFVGDATLVAHNAGFDVAFVNAELANCSKNLLAAPNVPAVDTLRCARLVFPGQPTYKQGLLAESLGITVRQAHRADDDARVCMEIFKKCMEQTATEATTAKTLATQALDT